jgi:hypothetical protein
MITSIKSTYGRICVLLSIALWVGFFGYQAIVIPLFLIASSKLGSIFSAGISILILGVFSAYVWPKTSYLQAEPIINSNKVTIGIFLLTIAFVAFPGSLLLPIFYAKWSGNSGAAILALYSIVCVPIFAILSIVGLLLVRSARPQIKNAN